MLVLRLSIGERMRRFEDKLPLIAFTGHSALPYDVVFVYWITNI